MAPSQAFFNEGDFFDDDVDYETNRCILIKQALMVLLSPTIYALAITADLFVVADDYKNGREVYALVTLALVLAPSVFFTINKFCTTIMKYCAVRKQARKRYIVGLACGESIVWLMLMPIMPLWPIIRSICPFYHALAAVCCSRKRGYHLSQVDKFTSAHLLKFLQAFTASAPQLVVRMHKMIQTNPDEPFRHISGAETAQIVCGLLVLGVTLVSTYKKSLTTKQIEHGRLSLQKLSFGSIFIGLLWWWCFLAARLPCIAIFIEAFQYWAVVALGLHVLFVFALQRYNGRHHLLRRIFVYICSGFIFLFAYLQLNMCNRSKSAWLPYALYSLLAFVEQTVMLTCWQLVKLDVIPYIPIMGQTNYNTSVSKVMSQEPTNNTTINCFNYTGSVSFYDFLLHCNYDLIIAHYVLFFLSVIFMGFAFCCAKRSSADEEYDFEDNEDSRSC